MAAGENVLIIVESPTKARTIRKFLGKNCKVLACMGHVRDLPRKAAEIPAAVKKEPWARLGVNVENDFEPLYVVPAQKNKTLTELRKALKEADSLYLATDEDREGESISWHLIQVLKPKIPTKRMVFHEITSQAIKTAFDTPRELDIRLVQAQEARRILDRLVGYTLSPLIWKKIAYGLSAGRVQSVALRALVELEKERMVFKRGRYWGVHADLQKDKADFEAKLVSLGDKKIAIGKDFHDRTGTLRPEREDSVILLDEKMATSLQQQIAGKSWKVREVEEKPVTRKPAPPFITSTLQQEANRKLGLSAKETMRIAQSLYEKGFITYMRTDSVSISQAAIEASRACVEKRFGKKYLSPSPRVFKSKSKAAQEAHEAIRPSLDFTPPSEMKLTGRDQALYELIWMRTVATQMADASQMQVSAHLVVDCAEGKADFYASGMKITFAGFLKAYVEGSDDPDRALANRERFLPDLKVGDVVNHIASKVTEHETKPPARYTEAALIQLMEKEGIGRPSTYATIVSTIIDRGYAKKQKNVLVPTFTGLAVTDLMRGHFNDLVDFGFTSKMENELDKIASGEQEYLPYLRDFYLGNNGLQAKVEKEDDKIDPEKARSIHFEHISNLDIRIGKYGAYFEFKDPETGEITKASVPEDMAPADLTEDSVDKIVEQVKAGPVPLATDPETQKKIFLRTGSYGPYLQLGDVADEETGKLKRVSVPKNIEPEQIDSEMAIKLINLPRTLGVHPDTQKPIITNTGRFGPYIMHDGDFRSLKKDDSILSIELPRALEILAMPKRSRRKGTALRDLGEHPQTKDKVEIFDGPYGHYFKVGKTNVAMPKEIDPEKVTLAEALVVLDGKIDTAKVAAKTAKAEKKKTVKKSGKKAAKKSKAKAADEKPTQKAAAKPKKTIRRSGDGNDKATSDMPGSASD